MLINNIELQPLFAKQYNYTKALIHYDYDLNVVVIFINKNEEKRNKLC